MSTGYPFNSSLAPSQDIPCSVPKIAQIFNTHHQVLLLSVRIAKAAKGNSVHSCGEPYFIQGRLEGCTAYCPPFDSILGCCVLHQSTLEVAAPFHGTNIIRRSNLVSNPIQYGRH